jgi:hypothetical protein
MNNYPQPPTNGAAQSHNLEPDPPSGMTAALRWTCRDCGHAVLDYLGNVYGSAVEKPCTGPYRKH